MTAPISPLLNARLYVLAATMRDALPLAEYERRCRWIAEGGYGKGGYTRDFLAVVREPSTGELVGHWGGSPLFRVDAELERRMSEDTDVNVDFVDQAQLPRVPDSPAGIDDVP